MSENFFASNESKFLHHIHPLSVVFKLQEAMINNWKDVLNNIPKINSEDYKIIIIFRSYEAQGKNPAIGFFSELGRYVKLKDLITSFERIKFQEGLEIVGYPKINLKTEVPNQLNKTMESCLEFREASGLPRHFYSKISTKNPLIIENQDIYSRKLNVCLNESSITWDVGTQNVYLEVVIENKKSAIKYKYQWYKGLTAIDVAKNLTAVERKLVFKRITIDDEDEYTCVVFDGITKVIAQPCNVKVNRVSPCVYLFNLKSIHQSKLFIYLYFNRRYQNCFNNW